MKSKSVKTPVKADHQAAELESLKSEIFNLKSSLARALADYANLEKRFARDSSSIVRFANANLVEKLLDIRDHLGLASVQIKDQSLTMILNSLDKLLVEEGVTEVKTDGPFDPACMECHETAPGAKDQVLEVVRRGYRLHDRVLRPARVVVGSGQPNPKGPEPVEGPLNSSN